jgi:deoxyribodipyrimidine photolyase-related protein
MNRNQTRGKRVPRLAAGARVRNLTLVLGDQLDPQAEALKRLDKSRDAVLMVEAAGESTHVRSHKQRIVLLLSAMRHFALDLHRRRYRVHYVEIDDAANTQSLRDEISRALELLRPEALTCTFPGEWRVKQDVEAAAKTADVPLRMLPDDHFLTSSDEFADSWSTSIAGSAKRLGVLMEATARRLAASGTSTRRIAAL